MGKRTEWHRQLLWTLSGLAGENLATAYLKWLCQDDDLRRLMLQHLLGDAMTGDHALVSVTTEVPTSDPDFGDGRIDLVIETMDMVIGIESKFYADFQEGQPAKYVATLRQLAEKADGGTKSVALVLLLPENRKFDLRTIDPIHEKYQPVVVKAGVWERLCAALSVDAPEIVALRGYIDECCNPFVQLNRKLELREPGFPPESRSAIGGPAHQSEFLAALRSFQDAVPTADLSGRIGHGTTWTCLNVSVPTRDGPRIAMLGFVNAKYYGISEAEGRVFVISLPQEISWQSNEVTPIGVHPVKRAKSPTIGITFHAKEDGSVWLVDDDSLLTGNEGKDGAACWIERLQWALNRTAPIA